jgi:hypothetical protein
VQGADAPSSAQTKEEALLEEKASEMERLFVSAAEGVTVPSVTKAVLTMFHEYPFVARLPTPSVAATVIV